MLATLTIHLHLPARSSLKEKRGLNDEKERLTCIKGTSQSSKGIFQSSKGISKSSKGISPFSKGKGCQQVGNPPEIIEKAKKGDKNG